MLKDMKCFKGMSDPEDMRKAIDALKAAEEALTNSFVSNPKSHAWARNVPVRLTMAYKIRNIGERISRIRQDMQEDDYQYRKYHELPPPPDGYT